MLLIRFYHVTKREYVSDILDEGLICEKNALTVGGGHALSKEKGRNFNFLTKEWIELFLLDDTSFDRNNMSKYSLIILEIEPNDYNLQEDLTYKFDEGSVREIRENYSKEDTDYLLMQRAYYTDKDIPANCIVGVINFIDEDISVVKNSRLYKLM